MLIISAPDSHAQRPLLTEFQASNSDTLLDEDGDSSDWIEIHNPTGTSLDLGGFFLTDDKKNLTRWQLPAPTPIPANGYVIVFASGKDRQTSGSEYHTDFKLSASGEYLALVSPDGMTLCTEYSPEYPQQYADTSYGLAYRPLPTTQPTYFAVPTPGAANGPGSPLLLNPGATPAQPAPGESVTVWVDVPTSLNGGSVTLHHRTNYEPEQSIPLLDDGLGADLTAGDGTYTATLPGSGSLADQMLRWRMTATDLGSGTASNLPLFVDPTGSAQYFGTAVRNDTLQTALRRWQYWLEFPGKGETATGTRASVYYDGEFYDNVKVRMRGGSSAWYPKKSYKFDFNKDQRLRFPSGLRHDEIDINTTWADKAFIRQPLSYTLYSLAGCASPESFPVRLERNGTFYSVAIFIEEPGEQAFLQEHGLDPNGALYKMYNVLDNWNQGVEKKTRLQESHADLMGLVKGLKQTSSSDLNRFLFDNIDLAMCLNYLAVTSLIHDNDHIAKNYFLYRDTLGDKEWQVIPWDKDLTWGRNYLISGGVLNDTLWANVDPFSHPLFGDSTRPKNDGPFNMLIDRLYDHPRIQQMYLRRLATLRDQFLEPASTYPHFLEEWIDDLVIDMAPDVALDQAQWGVPNWGIPFTFQEDVARIKTKYLRKRRQHLYVTHGPAGSGLLPPPNPNPSIVIRAIQGDPVSGKKGEEYVVLDNPSPLAADLSGYYLGGAVRFIVPEGTVMAGGDQLYISPNVKLFRKRSTPPSGNMGLHVTGPYHQHIEKGETVRLWSPTGQLVDEMTY